MKVSKEFKIGILVLVGALLLFQGIGLIKSGFFTTDYDEYYAIFDNATGLEEGNEVQLNGVKIGEVLEVKLHPLNPVLVLTKFNITERNLTIPNSSEAWLISTDVLGTKCIDLRIDHSDTASNVKLKDGDTLNSKKALTLEEELMAHLDPLKNKTEKLVGRVENIIIEINELWDSSASYTFEESVYQAREAIGTYKVLVRNMINMINRESQMSTKIGANIAIIQDSILNKMNAINGMADYITSLQGDFTSSGIFVETADLNISLTNLNNLISEIEKGNGTYGALTQTTEFKDAMSVTQTSMDNLLNNMTADPMKYVGLSIFGKKVRGLELTPDEEKILENWLAR